VTTLAWIIACTLLGGVISVAAAAAVALRVRISSVPVLVSYSVGALLGAAFLAVLPHAVEVAGSPAALGASILAGLMFFFTLEKLVLWRHHHAPQWGEAARRGEDEHGEDALRKHPVHEHPAHQHSGHEHHGHGRSGMMIMIGDTFHNFVDGVLIAAAFLADWHLGLVTAIAIMAHEVPSEVGDFLVLLHSGYSRRTALVINVLSSTAMVAGGLLGYAALNTVQSWIPSLLGFVAASMIYVAVADLIPGLHKRVDLRATVQQVGLIGLGIATIALVTAFISH
jgi:zinc and cadmium transporter